MVEVVIDDIKKYIEEIGLKQKYIASETNIDESRLCLILQGKRNMKAGEYANICKALKVPMDKFLTQRPDEL